MIPFLGSDTVFQHTHIGHLLCVSHWRTSGPRSAPSGRGGTCTGHTHPHTHIHIPPTLHPHTPPEGGGQPGAWCWSGQGTYIFLQCLLAWGVPGVSQAQSSSAGTEDEIGSPRAALNQARATRLFTSQLGKRAGSLQAGEWNGVPTVEPCCFPNSASCTRRCEGGD